MAGSSSGRTKAFISYSHQDAKYLKELQQQLAYFEQMGLVDFWADTKLIPGSKWLAEITEAINSARVAVLLISAAFLASDFIAKNELPPLLEAADKEGLTILTVILSPSLFTYTDLVQYQTVNGPSQPLSKMKPGERAQVWVRVAELVKDALKVQKLGGVIANTPQPKDTSVLAARAEQPAGQLLSQKTKEEWLNEGKTFFEAKQYKEALVAYEMAIQLEPHSASAHTGKARTLNELERFQEALIAVDRAIKLNPNDAHAYNNKGSALIGLERYEEALPAIEEALKLQAYPAAYRNKGDALRYLKQYEEAIIAYDLAIKLDPTYARAYRSKGAALRELKRSEEALEAYNRAIRFDSAYARAYGGKGYVLLDLKRSEEALKAFDQAIALFAAWAVPYAGKGEALKSLGKTTEAEQAFQKARELGYKE